MKKLTFIIIAISMMLLSSCAKSHQVWGDYNGAFDYNSQPQVSGSITIHAESDNVVSITMNCTYFTSITNHIQLTQTGNKIEFNNNEGQSMTENDAYLLHGIYDINSKSINLEYTLSNYGGSPRVGTYYGELL